MYLEHFGLEQFPFTLTPDTEFFLDYGMYKDALELLQNALVTGEGFTKVIGEVGTGKTLLCRKMLSALDDSFVTAYIPNPSLEPRALYMSLAKELGIKYDNKIGQPRLLELINGQIMALHAEDKQVVLLIDEAQTLPDDSMEALRLLSNLETEKSKLVQLVLFGQPELDIRLQQDHLRQLQQRMLVSYTLEPLAAEALDVYMQHRLHVAGYRGVPLFSPRALTLLQRGSRGVPRLINVLAHQAMLEAFGRGDKIIDGLHLRKAIASTKQRKTQRQRRTERAVSISAAGVFIAVVLAGFVPSRTARIQLAQAPNQTCLETALTSTSQPPIVSVISTVPLPALYANNLKSNYSASVEVTQRGPAENQQLLSEFIEAAYSHDEGSFTETERQLEHLLSQDNDQHQTPNQSHLQTAAFSTSALPPVSFKSINADSSPEPNNSLSQNSAPQPSLAKSKITTSTPHTEKSKATTSKASTAKSKATTSKASTAKSKATTSKASTAKSKATTSKASTAKSKATTSKASTAKSKATTSKASTAKSKATTSKARSVKSKATTSKARSVKSEATISKARTVKSEATISKARTVKSEATTSQALESAENLEPNSTASIEVIHRPLTEKQQRLNEFNVAVSTYNEGNFTAAERRLEGLLARDKGQHQARLLLTRLYTQQQLNSRAESVLSNGLLHYPKHVAYVSLYAQMLAAQGRDSEAINVLQNALPDGRENANFNALLAGLHQRTGNSAAAIESYLFALRLEPEHGEWWIGLGISNDQSGDWATATNAYREALQHPLPGAVEQYAKQRLQQLAAKNTTTNNQNNK